jgi:hypothetical protein
VKAQAPLDRIPVYLREGGSLHNLSTPQARPTVPTTL